MLRGVAIINKHRPFNQCLTFYGPFKEKGWKIFCHPLLWGGGTCLPCPPSSYATGSRSDPSYYVLPDDWPAGYRLPVGVRRDRRLRKHYPWIQHGNTNSAHAMRRLSFSGTLWLNRLYVSALFIRYDTSTTIGKNYSACAEKLTGGQLSRPQLTRNRKITRKRHWNKNDKKRSVWPVAYLGRRGTGRCSLLHECQIWIKIAHFESKI